MTNAESAHDPDEGVASEVSRPKGTGRRTYKGQRTHWKHIKKVRRARLKPRPRTPIKRGDAAPESGRDLGETRRKRAIKSLLEYIRPVIAPYGASSEKSLREPRARTSKTRTIFYVGEPSRETANREEQRSALDEVTIVAYLDTDDEEDIARVLERVGTIRKIAGYGPEKDVFVRRGSIFWRSRAAVQRTFASREVQDRLVKLERALELAIVDKRQAEYDSVEAEAIQKLIESLQDIPRACVRSGSLFLIKFQAAGESVILVRNLSQVEVRALDRFPEIQTRPEQAFAALAIAVELMEGARAQNDAAGLGGSADGV